MKTVSHRAGALAPVDSQPVDLSEPSSGDAENIPC